MARRIYLHIGTMKSATTYLQELGELNADLLAEAGVYWPTVDRYHAIRDFFGQSFEGTDVTGSWGELVQEIERHDGDVLYSNELLASLNPRQTGRIVDAFSLAEVHVIITARDLARVMPGHWQTTIRNGSTVGWLDFAAGACADGFGGDGVRRNPAVGKNDRSEVERLRDRFWWQHDVAAIIKRWKQFVPTERITLVTVPPAGSDRDLVARRFGRAVGVSLDGLAQPSGFSNSSLGAYSAELMRRLNGDMADVDRTERKYGFRDALARAVLAVRADTEPGYALSQSQQDWVARRAGVMIEAIASSGITVEGSLDDLRPAPHPPSGIVDPADASEQQLLEAASHGLIGMVKVVAGLQMERDAPRQKETHPMRS